MKIEMGKQYRTRDGQEVRIYAVDAGGFFPVHGAIKVHSIWVAHNWRDDGGRTLRGSFELDLVEVRPRFRFERWVNVHKIGVSTTFCSLFEANSEALPSRIACVKVVIEGEEGDGLDSETERLKYGCAEGIGYMRPQFKEGGDL